MLFCLWFSVICGALCSLVYIFLIWNFTHWRRRGINGPQPRPLLGSFPNLLMMRQHFADDLRDIYMKYRCTDSFVGVYMLRTPQLLLLEPQLVHEVFVSAFKHFEDNDAAKLVNGRKDPLIACNPFVLLGNDWRQQRALISPVLSGVRIKLAYGIMQRVCRDLCQFIDSELRCAKRAFDGKALALRFVADQLFDCVLGIQAQSFSAQPLPVAQNIRQLSEENLAFVLAGALAGLCPQLLKYFRLKIFPKACEQFFTRIIGQALHLRRQVHLERNDFMNQLLELQQQHQLSDLQLTSHAMTFLIDGLDTTAASISHCLLLLARNPSCQSQLLAELRAACAGDDSDNCLPSYDQLNELPYLDACFHESLRIYPPGLWAAKTCTEAYKFESQKLNATLQVEAGDTILIPIYGLHHDPLIYEQPEAFRPERFLPKNGGVKKYRNMGAFLGFGDGPRQCLGVRLALVQAKAAIAAIVRRFEVHANERTLPGQQLDAKVFVAMHKGGVWLDFVDRSL